MNDTSTQQRISVDQAAQILYRTKRPTDAQVQQIIKMLVYGVLAGEKVGHVKQSWQTTTGAVADLMARQAVKKKSRVSKARPRDAASSAQAAISSAAARPSQKADKELRGAYSDAMRDYFLAVMLRRKIAGRGAAFQRSVLFGQLAMVVLVFSVTTFAIWGAFKPEPPHHVAVRNWIEQKHEKYTVLQWEPLRPSPSGDGQLLGVKFRYFGRRNRPIDTHRIFLLSGNRVVGQFSEEDADD